MPLVTLTNGCNISLSEMLALPLPTLPVLASSSIVTGTGTSLTAPREGEPLDPRSKWGDEEEQQFYEDLLDLKSEVPLSVLGTSAPSAPSAAPETETETATEVDTEPKTVADGATNEECVGLLRVFLSPPFLTNGRWV
jgi:regulator of nonsense transcripts 2